MKKLILSLSSAILILSSCGEKDQFVINGTLAGAADSTKIYLQTLDSTWTNKTAIDSAYIKDGKFEFKGIAKEEAKVHFLALEEPTEKVKGAVLLVVEPGKINVVLDSISTVTGTPSNDSYKAFNDKMAKIDEELNAISEKSKIDSSEVSKNAIEKESKEKYQEKMSEVHNYIKSNIQNQAGTYLLISWSRRLELDQLKDLFAAVKPEYKKLPQMQKLEERIQVLDATAVGKMFTDLKAKSPEGKDIALSDYAGKGKYVLVDFWASWCYWCRVEMPTLVDLYSKYKSKDFEIVGISMDRTNEDWVKGIKEEGITWPQISDLKYWQSELGAKYGITGIPHLMLLDKDGKIIARGLSANEVKEKLAELLD